RRARRTAPSSSASSTRSGGRPRSRPSSSRRAHTSIHGGPVMDIGLCIFATDYAIRIDELARAAEDRGYESLFVPEHTHIPTSRRTPFPGGGELPREYSHTYDPFVSLMAAAAATRRLKVGTGICLIIERDTIVT